MKADGVRTFTAQLLGTGGYTVLEADQGAAALRLAEQHPGPIHALVTAVVLPGMNGRELASRLAQQRPVGHAALLCVCATRL